MSTYEITVEEQFVATHSTRSGDGTMEMPHEHTWRVEASFRRRELSEDGFVIDFLAVRGALTEIAARLTGADLNDAIGPVVGGASAERVAAHLAGELTTRLGAEPYCVRVAEAAGCWAAFYP